jgi:fatty-acyl-CoA synthase
MTRARAREGLLGWMERPSTSTGISFAAGADDWSRLGYDELAVLARRAATELTATGVRPGDVVSLVLPSPRDFVVSFFGALVAGATPSPMALPHSIASLDTYLDHAAGILRVASPRVVVAPPELRDLIAGAAAGAGLHVPVHSLSLAAEPCWERRDSGPLALLQFTSGSSGRPRGVRVTWENLETNIDLLVGWLQVDDDSVVATWLPLYHDMGLIGCLLMPVTHQVELWSMRPEQFVREPARWLECLGRRGATLTASPSFGYDYVLRRVAPDALDGMDFSRCRGAVVGAERIDPSVLRRFTTMLAPFGFSSRVFRPAYGLAEATLAVCGGDDGPVRVVRPDWQAMAPGQDVVVEADTTLDEAGIDDGAGWIVSCGPPHPGFALDVIDDDGTPLGEGKLGELAIRGPSVAAGYLGDPTAATTRFDGDRLETGDAAFVRGGEVFVIGRIGDSMKVRGRHLYAEDLEARVIAATSLQAHRLAVVLGTDRGSETVGLVLEGSPDEQCMRAALGVLRREAGPRAHIRLHRGPRGTIARTSSGKVRRRELWRRLIGGELRGEHVLIGEGPEREVAGPGPR